MTKVKSWRSMKTGDEVWTDISTETKEIAKPSYQVTVANERTGDAATIDYRPLVCLGIEPSRTRNRSRLPQVFTVQIPFWAYAAAVAHLADSTVGVMYPLSGLMPAHMQQIRLHQEAKRRKIRLKTRRWGDYLVLRFERLV